MRKLCSGGKSEWRGKLDLQVLGTQEASVIWLRKVKGLETMPIAGGTHTRNGFCSVPVEIGQTYERYVMVCPRGKDGKVTETDYRSLSPYTVPTDAKELPMEKLIPGPAGSGKPLMPKSAGGCFNGYDSKATGGSSPRSPTRLSIAGGGKPARWDMFRDRRRRCDNPPSRSQVPARSSSSAICSAGRDRKKQPCQHGSVPRCQSFSGTPLLWNSRRHS